MTVPVSRARSRRASSNASRGCDDARTRGDRRHRTGSRDHPRRRERARRHDHTRERSRRALHAHVPVGQHAVGQRQLQYGFSRLVVGIATRDRASRSCNSQSGSGPEASHVPVAGHREALRRVASAVGRAHRGDGRSRRSSPRAPGVRALGRPVVPRDRAARVSVGAPPRAVSRCGRSSHCSRRRPGSSGRSASPCRSRASSSPTAPSSSRSSGCSVSCHRGSPARATTCAIWLVALFPSAFVFSMVYPSAIFLAASVWAFVFLADGHDGAAAVDGRRRDVGATERHRARPRARVRASA